MKTIPISVSGKNINLKSIGVITLGTVAGLALFLSMSKEHVYIACLVPWTSPHELASTLVERYVMEDRQRCFRSIHLLDNTGQPEKACSLLNEIVSRVDTKRGKGSEFIEELYALYDRLDVENRVPADRWSELISPAANFLEKKCVTFSPPKSNSDFQGDFTALWSACNHLSRSYLKHGNQDRAIYWQIQSCKMTERRFGPLNNLYIHSLLALTQLYKDCGRPQDAWTQINRIDSVVLRKDSVKLLDGQREQLFNKSAALKLALNNSMSCRQATKCPIAR
ncbi:MAG: hypothetical protein WCT03_14170 [Candidatus Obscuribacterales bacterium]|jgi:hypothetical protein